MIYKIQRHLFLRLLKTFSLFIALLLITYTLLDFCTKAADFSDTTAANYLFMLQFYGAEFSKRAHLFIPICFTLAMLLQFIRLSKTKELVALLCAGIPYRKILTPFWLMASIVTLFLFVNRQYIVPPTRDFLETYRNDHVRALKKAKNADEIIFALILKDDSKLLYQSYDPVKKTYFDLFWIVSPQRILRIKYLEMIETGYKARFVDELTRNQMGTLQKKHSFKELSFSKEWLKGAHFDKSLPIQTQSLNEMASGLKEADYIYSKDEVFTEIFVVIIMSLSPLWLVAMQAPILTRYTRQIPVLFYVGSQLLFFFCSSTIVDGFSIIAQRSIISPWILLFIPFICSMGYLGYRYRKSLS
jgi:lipopolysaccharide export LptBFGC system permease protein LptF